MLDVGVFISVFRYELGIPARVKNARLIRSRKHVHSLLVLVSVLIMPQTLEKIKLLVPTVL